MKKLMMGFAALLAATVLPHGMLLLLWVVR